MAEFGEEDLSGSTFDWTDLSGSTFRAASLSNVTIRGTDLHHVKMTGVELFDVDISGEVNGLRINGVDVTAYVEEELARREPDLAKMHPDDPAGFREAWDLLERLWDGTVERARRLDPARCTSRSTGSGRSSRRCGTSRSRPPRGSTARSAATRPMAPARPAVGRGTQGQGLPARPLGPAVPGRGPRAPPHPTGRGTPSGRGLTEETLAAETTLPDDGGWPPAPPLPVKECLSIVLNEGGGTGRTPSATSPSLEKRPR